MILETDVPLAPLTTFGIQATARYFSSFDSIESLSEITGTEYHQDGKTLILGGGSNLLFTKDYDGLVLRNEIRGIEIVREDEEAVWIKAGAGENWHQFVLFCLERNYAGIENLSLIPGNVGASPMQNIGAYGVEIKDVFFELEAFHLQERTTRRF